MRVDVVMCFMCFWCVCVVGSVSVRACVCSAWKCGWEKERGNGRRRAPTLLS